MPPLIGTTGTAAAKAFGLFGGKAKWSGYKITGASGNSYGNNVTGDSSGNIYAVGSIINTYNTFILLKLTSSGTVTWQRELQQSAALTSSEGRGIAVDGSGNVYVTGYATSGSTRYILTAKYNSSGTLQFQRSLQENSSTGYAVAVESAGANIYVLGTADDGSRTYAVLAKYNSSGTIQWQRKYYSSSVSGGGAVTVDSANNPIIVGSVPAPGGNTNWFVVKYNSSGTLQWQRWITDNTNTFNGTGVAVDSSNNIYTAGWDNGGGPYLTVYKYNSTGTFQWSKAISVSGGGSTYSGAISVGSDNNVYAVGYSNTGMLVVAMDSSGNILWQRQLRQSSFSATGVGIYAGGSGTNLFVNGWSGDGSVNYFSTSILPKSGAVTSGTAFLTMTVPTITTPSPVGSSSTGTGTDAAGTATASTSSATDSAGTATVQYATS